MTGPLIVLAILSTIGVSSAYPMRFDLCSWYPTNYIERTLEPVVKGEPGRGLQTPEVNWASASATANRWCARSEFCG